VSIKDVLCKKSERNKTELSLDKLVIENILVLLLQFSIPLLTCFLIYLFIWKKNIVTDTIKMKFGKEYSKYNHSFQARP